MMKMVYSKYHVRTSRSWLVVHSCRVLHIFGGSNLTFWVTDAIDE